jgi:hypothetical protein
MDMRFRQIAWYLLSQHKVHLAPLGNKKTKDGQNIVLNCKEIPHPCIVTNTSEKHIEETRGETGIISAMDNNFCMNR